MAEDPLRALIQAAPNPTVVVDKAGRIRLVNAAAERLFGYLPGELIDQPIEVLVPQRFRAPLPQRRAAFFAAPAACPLGTGRTLYARCKDGTEVAVEIGIAPLVTEHDTFAIASVVDITAHTHAQEQLRRANTFLDSIVENIPHMIFVKDASDLAFVLFNRAGQELLGYARTDLIGKNDYDFFPKQEADFFTENDRAVLRSKALLDIPEEPIETAQRGVRILHTKKIPLLGADGEPAYLLGISEDITERKRAEERLRRHERETAIVGDILRVLNTHVDVKAAFPEVCSGLREQVGCAGVSINLFDEHREWLTFVAADAPWAIGVSQDVRLRVAELPAVTDVLAGRAHVVSDLATELEFPLVQIVYGVGYRSVISLPLCAGSDVVGILNLFWREVDGCHTAEMGWLTQVTNAVAIAVEKHRLFEEVTAGHARLEALSRRLFELQESERRHLARELHDEIGQYLTGVGLILRGVERQPRDIASGQLREVGKLVDDLTARVRGLSLDLRPPMLDDLGLLPALLWLVERFATQTNMRIDFQHRGVDRRFSPEVETVAYRVVQEALTNVARHANVSDARVYVWAEHRVLSAVVADRGTGFDVHAELARGTATGLAGMRERATLLGGQLSIESGPLTGTLIRAELPVVST